ncbi:uncharacterized protein Z518_01121 [Rhinocladiella mackenziei CBS 650.93]|uniref:Oxidoreductase acuF-like C2H2 type zinc-finger domain-containing protein n=1 Tax=Rhinocladiella mackenziei CBS 650.93 TaxID=1442369 RepID=A0A0D2JKR9_9EURO|nr:uncharacterized protein Z518_01121 [Rhinocladiella mackenziei CBS 650.93]KIX10040.1 hypothetical protein Z518_01121 [Rhinocladiella mackenziei CBS 650.93]
MGSTQDIAHYGRAIQTAFIRLSEVLHHAASPVEDLTIFLERTRQSFLFWAANLGMFDEGHRSMDYRLQDAQDVKEYMVDLLEELEYNLNELAAACTNRFTLGLSSPDDEDKGADNVPLSVKLPTSTDEQRALENEAGAADEDEIRGRIESVDDLQRRLYGLAHRIRHPTMRSAPGSRNVYRTIPSSDRLGAIKQLLDLERGRITDYFLQTRRALADMKDAQTLELTQADERLIERLSQSNSLRRQQFIFWRETQSERNETVGRQLLFQQEDKFIPQPTVDQVFALPDRNRPAQTIQLSMPSSVTKLPPGQLDLAERFSVATRDTRTPSAYGPTDEKLSWPAVPPEFKPGHNGFFICPYCHTICPNRYLNAAAWKSHLLHDLRPYCCTYEQCKTERHVYDSQNVWSAHEALEHNGVFTCLEHPSSGQELLEFADLDEYKQHVHEHHSRAASSMLQNEIVRARRNGSLRSNRPCPICLTQILDAQNMSKHVAGHLEIIALMALPRSTGLEAESQSGNAGSGQQGQLGTDSRADISDLPLLENREEEPYAGEASDESFEHEALTSKKRAFEAELPDTLTSMANLASTYRNQGRWQEAEELDVQVMETSSRVLGAEHLDTLTSMTNLASTYWNQGRWQEAEELEVQVMETSSRVLGAEHPSTLISMANLASTYSSRAKWQEAEELEVQVMETSSRVLGAEHPDTLTSMANLATTYWNQGRWQEAEELGVQVMETRKRVLGAEHPDTLTSMANLASTYSSRAKWQEAEELEVQVMETTSRVLGAEHPSTLTSMTNLASTYWNQGRWQEAEGLNVQVMETRKRVLEAEHPDTLTSMANLASTYRNQGRWKEAEGLEVQVMETSSRVLGAEHPDTLTSMANLASTYWNQGRWQEAEELGVQVMETRKRVLGAVHPDTLTSMANLASTYR